MGDAPSKDHTAFRFELGDPEAQFWDSLILGISIGEILLGVIVSLASGNKP